MKYKLCVFLLTLAMFPLFGEEIKLEKGKLSFVLNTKTFAASASCGSFEYVVSDRISLGNTEVLEIDDTRAVIYIPKKDMTFTVEMKDDHMAFSFITDKEGEIQWPRYRAERKSKLIWMKGDGRHIPQSDRQWIKYLKGEHGLDESPLWGHSQAEGTAAWVAETPFRSSMAMNGRRYSLNQSFLVRRGEEEHRFRLGLSEEEDPLLPGKLYRSYLIETDQFQSYEEKLKDIPEEKRNRLEGAVHIYLWGNQRIGENDILPRCWQELALSLLENNSFNESIRNRMDGESLAALREIAATERPYPYLKFLMTKGISEALDHIDIDAFWDRYGGFLRDREECGQGVSPAFVRDLRSLGIDRARLTRDDYATTPIAEETARAAEEAGYLFGIYDGYDSIHPVSLAGTDDSWQTAQFTQELYDQGGVMKKDGNYYDGFQGIGRQLSPLAARPHFEQRVSQNLSSLPMSFYFMDCDGAGEIHEDYNPRYSATSEETVEARKSRLRWLRTEKGLFVGTEGGDPFTVSEVFITEGPFSPAFYWENPGFRDKDSPYFMGSWWPPEAPEINFKESPLIEDLIVRYFDPATRIPLFQTIFHDSVLTTNHWHSDMFKYEKAQKILQLQQMLYLSPPLYNLNRERLAEKSETIVRNYNFFSPLHKEYGFSRLESFKVLSQDGLVQKTEFDGGLEMFVNFSQKIFNYKGMQILPMTAVAHEWGKEPRSFTP